MDQDWKARARLYVERSNRHDLDAVLPMFAEDATYESSEVGSFAGRAVIEGMMRSFFARFPDVAWEIDEVRELADAGAEFAFVMTATSAETGEVVVRRGRERIFFNRAGLIRHVGVLVGTA